MKSLTEPLLWSSRILITKTDNARTSYISNSNYWRSFASVSNTQPSACNDRVKLFKRFRHRVRTQNQAADWPHNNWPLPVRRRWFRCVAECEWCRSGWRERPSAEPSRRGRSSCWDRSRVAADRGRCSCSPWTRPREDLSNQTTHTGTHTYIHTFIHRLGDTYRVGQKVIL